MTTRTNGDLKERQLKYHAVSGLKPDPANPRKHSAAQIRAIASSIRAFGFNAPVLADGNGTVLAGHGRLEAAKMLEMDQVPVVFLDDLTPAQAKAYRLAKNRRQLVQVCLQPDCMPLTKCIDFSEVSDLAQRRIT